MTKIVEVREVFKSYRQGGVFGRSRKIEVLKNINLVLEEGECLGLLGSSGSGKSTLGRPGPGPGVARFGHDSLPGPGFEKPG